MKKRILISIMCIFVIVSCLIVPTLAASLDGTTEDQMNYGQFYQVDVNYRPPTYQEQVRVEWQPWPNGFVEADYQNAWHIHNTQYVYMRVPRDANNNPIGAISIVFEDTDERMWLIRDYSVRFQWWRNEHGTEYEYVSEIVFTNNTGEGADQQSLCFRWSSIDGYGLYDQSKDVKLKDLTGYISLYFNQGDIFGVTTYSSGGYFYGLNNWYTAFGQVEEILTPSYYVGVDAAEQAGYEAGYNEGYTYGNDVGFGAGYGAGYGYGYQVGQSDALQSEVTLSNTIFTIFDAPFYILTTALDFELFGINIAGTLIGIISLALIVFILKIIIVRLF